MDGWIAIVDFMSSATLAHVCSRARYEAYSMPYATSKYPITLPFSARLRSAQRVLAVTLFGAPLAPCLLWIRPVCPLAAPAAVFAFSAFFLLSAAVFFSLPSLIAAWRAAARASGRWARRSLITSSDAPTMARWCFTVRRVRFLAISWSGYGRC